MHTNKTIKPFKGHMIELSYKNKAGLEHNIAGEIVASSRMWIIFAVNKSTLERPIKYSDIIKINKPEK